MKLLSAEAVSRRSGATLNAVATMALLTLARVQIPEPPARPGMAFREEVARKIRHQHKRGEFSIGVKFQQAQISKPRTGVEVEKGNDTLVPKRGIYRICFTLPEARSIERAAVTFDMATSDWVAGLGRGTFSPPFHRMGLAMDDGPKSESIKISIFDDEYDDVITRLRMAQPLLAARIKAITFAEYFRQAAVGRILAPRVRGEHRDPAFPLNDVPKLQAVQNLVWAAQTSHPRPNNLRDFEEAQRDFRERLWHRGWTGTQQEYRGFLDRTTRLRDLKLEGPVSDTMWNECLQAIKNLGRSVI